MNIDISKRRETLNTIILVILILVAINVSRRIPQIADDYRLQIVAVLTSAGAYRLTILAIYFLINRWRVALRLYWGELYLMGLWSYEYFLENKMYYGVWDIRQDVDGLRLVGNGLDEHFRLRTIVRSVSPLVPEEGGYFLINRRNEISNKNAQVFSKSTLLLDRPRKYFGDVTSMRGITEVFGGPSDRQVHPNVQFQKHVDVETIEELIEKLKGGRSIP